MYCAHVLAAVLTILPGRAALASPQDTISGARATPSATPSRQRHTPRAAASDATPQAKSQTSEGQAPSAQSAGQQSQNDQPKNAQPQSDQPKAPKLAHRIVVREGSTAEPTAQLVPGLTQEQANRQRQITERLLSATVETLRITGGRSLNADQQETVAEVRSFMAGARAALDKGDPQRARNLAFKAYLLSDDLLKH
jgi:hypothetical protein